MALAPDQTRIGLRRWFTIEGVHPDDELGMGTSVDQDHQRCSMARRSLLKTMSSSRSTWSETAGKIVAQKYFRGQIGTDEREWSLRQVIDRVVSYDRGLG